MRQLIYILATVVLAACTHSVPNEYSEAEEQLSIYPNYREVLAPSNIAPLTFHIYDTADVYVTRLSLGDKIIIVDGQDVVPDIDEWHEMIKDGGELKVENYLKRDGKWGKYPEWTITIKSETIDNYLTYRLVSPGYIIYNDLSIRQRDLTSWDENVIYDTRITSTEGKAQCINCHSFQNYDGEKMQFHVRAALGGTVFVRDGKIEKVNLKTDSTMGAGVYPAWHPTENLIAYSINKTGQVFHTRDRNKVEVMDEVSDMILYDPESNTVYPVCVGTKEFECFPTWSPDGKWLYYSKADYNVQSSENEVWDELCENFYHIKYNIVRKRFDLDTKTFGEEEMVLKADTMPSRYYVENGLSATLPRFSPDGRYLAVTLGAFGVFHIWHRDADVYKIDMQTGEGEYMDGLNSRDVDSYHSWSSNGHWMVVSSRREDGAFTRPYISYIDDNGTSYRPFVLPQKNPLHNKGLQRSYNVPELTRTPVNVSVQELATRIKIEAKQAKYAQ